MKERPHSSEIEHDQNMQLCASMMVRHFKEGQGLLLDVDGPILKQHGLLAPTLATNITIPAIKAIEDVGIQVGIATARGETVVPFLRDHGLKLLGPTILESGQVMVVDGHPTYFATDEHRHMIKILKENIIGDPLFRPSWEEVVKGSVLEKGLFCQGDSQWQGECRLSYWTPLQKKLVPGNTKRSV